MTVWSYSFRGGRWRGFAAPPPSPLKPKRLCHFERNEMEGEIIPTGVFLTSPCTLSFEEREIQFLLL